MEQERVVFLQKEAAKAVFSISQDKRAEKKAILELEDSSHVHRKGILLKSSPSDVNDTEKDERRKPERTGAVLRPNQTIGLRPTAPSFTLGSRLSNSLSGGIPSHVMGQSSPCSCYHSSTTCIPFCTLYANIPIPLASQFSNTSKPIIRLACLKPGLPKDPLECTLFSADLSIPTRFSALSYVWGDIKIRQPIIVNRRVVNVTQNLYSALSRLRKTHSSVVLWVDAICIDQQSLKERGSQVKEMPNIYGAAEEVIAWLGDGDQYTDVAMEYVSNHGGRKKPLDQRCNDLNFEIEVALNHLWSRSYWSRVWVVQELASSVRSRHRCIFHCGSKTVSYNVMRKFLTCLFKKVLVLGTDSVLNPRRMITLSSSSSRMSILEILWDSALLQSTDPRDRIYGIRGISPQYYQDTIKVDYTINFSTLCRKFMTYNIKKERSLDILCYFHLFPSLPGNQVPSWLCDLRYRHFGIAPFVYSASLNYKACAKITNNVLQAKGLRIGTVKERRGPLEEILSSNALNLLASNSLGMVLQTIESVQFETLKRRYPDESRKSLESKFMDLMAGNRQYEAEKTKISLSSRQLWDKVSGKVASGKEEWDEVDRQFRVVFERHETW
ncbi:hypothetical protein G7Y89_g15702 [Cudoniella acicularis]|uniref:Heterokaryon incompatibility domain-containing protein n=1 Tax=Cudoniella acicularis TaxID=354080 RepID=A0A8H4QHD2_9HELO|nr:hypothetical protein G7Y89_g15702 [Cudoniella acicularis]